MDRGPQVSKIETAFITLIISLTSWPNPTQLTHVEELDPTLAPGYLLIGDSNPWRQTWQRTNHSYWWDWCPLQMVVCPDTSPTALLRSLHVFTTVNNTFFAMYFFFRGWANACKVFRTQRALKSSSSKFMEAIIAAFKHCFDCLQHLCFLKAWTRNQWVNYFPNKAAYWKQLKRFLFLYSKARYLFSKGILNSRTIYLK